jgi:hypothetical protein
MLLCFLSLVSSMLKDKYLLKETFTKVEYEDSAPECVSRLKQWFVSVWKYGCICVFKEFKFFLLNLFFVF